MISWGAAGTLWLARALNSHPDALVLHAADAEWRLIHGQPPVDQIRYLQWLEEMALGSYQITGDVHGIHRHAVPEISEFFGSRFAAAVLVREPLARLRSQLGHFDEMAYSSSLWPVDYVDSWAASFGMDAHDLTQRDRCYLHGINMLNAITEEREVGPIYRMEDLTTSARAFTDLVAHLSSHTIGSPRSWVRSVLRARRVNPHASHGTAGEDLHGVSVHGHPLPDLLRAMVSPEAWSAYEALGYADARRLLEG